MVVGAPRAQAVAAVVPGVEHVAGPDPRRDQDAPMGHDVPTGHDVPMVRHRATRAAVVRVVAVPVVEDARQAAGAAAPGDLRAMPVVVIVAQVAVVMRGRVVATVAMERGHRARNRARQPSGARQKCVHAVAGCANHKMSPGPPSRSAGRTLARSTRSGATMR